MRAVIDEQTTKIILFKKMRPLVAVNSRYVCKPQPLLPLISILPSRPPSSSSYAVHFVGGFRRPSDALSPSSSLAAHRIASLGNPYRSSSVALSIDAVGELARRPRRNRAIPRRIPTPLSGQTCVSRHFRQRADHRRGNRLRRQSGVLRSTSVDQLAGSPLTTRSCWVGNPFA